MNIQFFAGEGKEKDNIKALRENRAEKVEELKLLYATLEAEERAITDDEEKRAETLNDEIKRIDKTIHILEDMKKNIGKLQLFLLGVLSAFSPLAMDLYLPGLPELQQDLHTSTSLAQVTITASLLGLALGQVIVGPWSDRIGRRKPLLWGTIAFALSSAAIVFAPNIWVLIILRLVQGLAGSTGIVLSLAVITDLFTGKTLTQQIAINQTINGVFPVLAPVFGGIIIAWADWQMTFWVLAVLGVLLFAGVLFSLPETLSAEKAAPQEKQSVVAGFGKLFKQRQFVLFALTQAFMTAALFAYISGSSFVLQKIFGLSVTTFGIVYGQESRSCRACQVAGQPSLVSTQR